MFDFINGFKCESNDLLTSSWFKGDFLAASNNLSYTFPSKDPRVDPKIASGMSKPSTIPIAMFLNFFKDVSKLD